ncbi:hypothetical protein JCGZ_07558 [Jatropha curcas]|uniref:Uncharacterized protein n=1 Tax=Jatropha curcas TaxID=180498 RepID=A0A067KCX1_JATCU|nr:uncharacterized protein LOC105638038 [Jatropha curcas]KDP33987.1 hypothetical protein JCGZ_07558 [Jatropha curcas]
MLKRQSTFRLFTNYFSAPNHRHHRHNYKALIMAYITRNDPFSKGFHNLPQPVMPSSSIIPFIKRTTVSIDNTGSASVGFRINRGRGVCLTVIGCSDSHKPPRAVAAPQNQLVREFENRLEDGSSSKTSARYINGHETCQGGKPLGFPDYPLTGKIVVAVDVDEVLGNFVSALNRFIADRYSSNHSVAEYHVYEFFKIWKCSHDEANIRVHEFFKTSYFKSGIYPIPGAQKVLHKLSRLCNLSVVTSRQNVIKDHTIEWIEKHYPGVFHEIHFGNHFALDGESRPKSEICRTLGATVLIDDNPRYAIECAEAGIKVLLFDYENSYPWCKTDLVRHPLVTKVHNWEQVEQHGFWEHRRSAR